MEEWTKFFEEVASLLQELNRQYGVGNLSYASYALERLEVCLSSCRSLISALNSVNSSSEALCNDLGELVTCLTAIRAQWLQYIEVLDSLGDATRFAFRAELVGTGHQGRPRFLVSREQIEYLWSLSFSWSEIASLLGISRSTLFR